MLMRGGGQVHMKDEDYKTKIIKLISKTKDNTLLELIYRFAKKLLG